MGLPHKWQGAPIDFHRARIALRLAPFLYRTFGLPIRPPPKTLYAACSIAAQTCLLRRSNSEDCACLSPRLHLPADWCKQAAAASGAGKEQGEPMEGEKRGLLAVEMKKDAAFIARVLGNIISDMRVCLCVQFTRPGAAGPSTPSGYGRTARAPRAFAGSSCRPTSSPCPRSTTPTTGRTGSGA